MPKLTALEKHQSRGDAPGQPLYDVCMYIPYLLGSTGTGRSAQ